MALWEAEHGKVPDGYVIHHKDWDKTHNELSNLVMVSIEEHNLIHNPPPVEHMTDREKNIIKKLKDLGLIK